MRKFTLSATLTVIFLGGAISGAGVIGTYGIVVPLLAGEPTPQIARTGAAGQVSVDGRVPVRLKSVVDGQFQPAESGTVAFVRSGRLVQQAAVGEGGTVQAENLEIGSYSVFVHGDDGYAAFSTWLAPSSVNAEAPSEILSVGLVPRGDMPIVKRIIRDHKNISFQGLPEFGEATTEVAVGSSRRSPSIAHGSAFQISPDGILRGRVVRDPRPDDLTPFSGASVYFVHSNQIVSQAVTDAEGLFEVQDFATGVFSLVVAGEGSFLAMSVEVVPSLPTVASTKIVNEIALVSLQGETPIPLIAPVFQEDVIVVEEYWLSDDESEAMAADGGFAGGGFGTGGGSAAGGGGGSAGGGGGLGDALAVGLIIGGAILIADDDDARVSNASP